MATFDFQVGTIQRSLGHTAVREAAYITGQLIEDQRTGIAYDFTRKKGVLRFEVIGPSHLDAGQFANVLEAREKRCNSITARTIQHALPEELRGERGWQALRRFGIWVWEHFGIPSLIGEHEPPQDLWSSGRNGHGHTMPATRLMDAAGRLGAKARAWDVKVTSHLIMHEMRAMWARILNEALAAAGFAARVDHRSLLDQGSGLLPKRYLPRAEYIAYKLHGVESRYVRENREIEAHNQLQKQITRLENQLHAAKHALRQRADRAIDAARRAVDRGKRTIDCGKRAVDRGKRAIANAACRIAGAARAIRISQHAIDEHHRRERRGPATLRQRVAQAFQRAGDHLPAAGRHPHRRDLHRGRQPSADAADCRGDTELRSTNQRAERSAPSPSQAESGVGDEDAQLITHAETHLDLAELLCAHGWSVAETNRADGARVLTCARQPAMRVTILPPAEGQPWQWREARTRREGGLVEALQHLLGFSRWEDIHTVIGDALASTQTADLLGRHLNSSDGAASSSISTVAAGLFAPLGERGRTKLATEFRLARWAIDAFAHAIWEDRNGEPFTAHEMQAGTENGQTDAAMLSSEHEGDAADQYSLWFAPPADGSVPTHLLLAPNLTDALHWFEELPEHLRGQVALASTDGPLTTRGREKLAVILGEMQRAHPTYEGLTLVDACSAFQPPVDPPLAAELFGLATDHGIGYFSCKPTQEGLQNDVEMPRTDEAEPFVQQQVPLRKGRR